jgi:acyl-CoA thioesterase-1
VYSFQLVWSEDAFVTEPFWSADRMEGESLLFTVESDGLARAPLLFAPTGPVTLQSATGDAVFLEGRDFVIDTRDGVIVLLPGSAVPRVSAADLMSSRPSDGGAFMHAAGDPARFLLFAEGDAFHRLQTVASYAHDPNAWTGHRPSDAAPELARTHRLLAAGTPLAIWVLGDSISEGYNASGFTEAAPHQAPYPGLLAASLERRGHRVAVRNLARAGATTNDGIYMVPDDGDVADLAIVAFGMNDAGYLSPNEFRDGIADVVSALRLTAPSIDLILVAPMLPHPDWHYARPERLLAYRDELASLTGPGTALADVTTLWRDLLTRKRHHDLTGNGINHPNDFGHRVYAHTILPLLHGQST